MKRHSYTITELLTVIAIIAILAGIAIPAVGYARRRARTSACISNQGQTMKTILNAMSDTNNRLYSGSAFTAPNTDGTVTSNAGWTLFLAEKGYIKNMDALRCTDINTYTTDGKTINANSLWEAYGLVTTSSNNSRFDFRGTKLFMFGGSNGTQVAPSVLAMGGCATSDGRTAGATINFGGNTGGRATGLHHNNMTNIFFFDGHAESVDQNSFAANRYYPDQTGNNSGEARALAAGSWLDAAR